MKKWLWNTQDMSIAALNIYILNDEDMNFNKHDIVNWIVVQ